MRFLLVHGGYHGAWCWKYLIPELEARGHTCLAVDLPGHGTRSTETSTTAGYRTAVTEVVEPGDVLVGHSLGGNTITMAASDFPSVGHLVYLAAQVPVEGRSMVYDLNGGSDGVVRTSPLYRYVRESIDGQRMEIVDPEGVKEIFYHDAPDELATWAAGQLTPQCIDVYASEPVTATGFWGADLPRSYIICRHDRALPRDYTLRQARRLGVDPLMIDSSHSPFLSVPGELADLLIAALDTEPVGPPVPTLEPTSNPTGPS